MAVHSLTDAPEMNLHDLPVELGLQYSYADMNGPFETVTAEEHDDRATGSNIDMVDEQQQTLLDESASNNNQVSAPNDRLQTLYNTYHTNYAFDITKNSAHMQHAKNLALALLRRHYPESQQYKVEATALGPLSRNGINFILKEPHEPDSDPDKQKRPTKSNNTLDHWHSIGPEKMAAFVVKKGHLEVLQGIERPTYRTHTYLYIVLDDLSTFYRWSAENDNCRGDVLTDLGTLGGISRGHGMLFFGPHLELYNYDASDVKVPVKPYQKASWRIDTRTTSLAEVDEVLRSFAKQEPVYKDHH